jgi:hypothetical protein
LTETTGWFSRLAAREQVGYPTRCCPGLWGQTMHPAVKTIAETDVHIQKSTERMTRSKSAFDRLSAAVKTSEESIERTKATLTRINGLDGNAAST